MFYYTLPVDASFVLMGCVLYYFRIPEICSPNNKTLNLYFSSNIILIICIMNLLYETQNVMLHLIKLNDGTLSKVDQDKWIEQ